LATVYNGVFHYLPYPADFALCRDSAPVIGISMTYNDVVVLSNALIEFSSYYEMTVDI